MYWLRCVLLKSSRSKKGSKNGTSPLAKTLRRWTPAPSRVAMLLNTLRIFLFWTIYQSLTFPSLFLAILGLLHIKGKLIVVFILVDRRRLAEENFSRKHKAHGQAWPPNRPNICTPRSLIFGSFANACHWHRLFSFWKVEDVKDAFKTCHLNSSILHAGVLLE